MGQMVESVCERLPSQACDRNAGRPAPAGSRTPLRQYILDPVLPMLTLLSMSALTVVMLVTVVAAVADMDLRLSDGYVRADPWADVQVGSASGFYPDQYAFADSTPLGAPRPVQEAQHDLPPALPAHDLHAFAESTP